MKLFPLQIDRRKETLPGPLTIPWSVAEIAYSEYARRYGKSQSLQELAERGGFSWAEMDMFYPKWRDDVSTIKTLEIALEESVKLQSHYAELLNGYDGGERIGFANSQEWIERLKELGRVK